MCICDTISSSFSRDLFRIVDKQSEEREEREVHSGPPAEPRGICSAFLSPFPSSPSSIRLFLPAAAVVTFIISVAVVVLLLLLLLSVMSVMASRR